MAASYLALLTELVIAPQTVALDKAIHWIIQLEQSHATLQQKVNQQTEEIEQQGRHLTQLLAESQRIHQQMVQMEKMAILGQMLSGISHEINNPINFIYGNLPYVDEHVRDVLSLLQAYQESGADQHPHIQSVLEEIDLEFTLEDLPRIVNSMKLGADRIRELVLTLRNFYRLDEREMQVSDLHTGIENTLLLLQHRYKPTISIVKEFGDLPAIECHINQLNQVFMNLLSNAIDALLEQASNQQPQIVIITQQLNSNQIAVSISDNGPGIPLEVQQRLFEPFFTTKPMGVGTGLGLSISHQIITETHHGRIFCCSAPGGGTTFMVELPIYQPVEGTQSHPMPSVINSVKSGF
ncbi:sensor histidine kinase [Pantanalinema sp. GBBB05]|uniref:sensor histidine kinase n=1 Tax=Pantanalinema sp. GBBB05 TaxID=2604139 RepID=UPI001D6A3D6B|nr:histidine kinase [Pantanalinema sp. GBBB05]